MLCEWEVRALHAVADTLLLDFDPRDALIYLESKGAITEDYVQLIESRPTRLERVREFIRIFKRKAESITDLVDYFEFCGQDHIAQEINEKLSSTSDDNEVSVTLEIDEKTRRKILRKLQASQTPGVWKHVRREKEEGQLAEVLRRNASMDAFCVVVHGFAGSGKTSLVASVLHNNLDLLAHYYDNVVWITDGREDEHHLRFLLENMLVAIRDDLDTGRTEAATARVEELARKVNDSIQNLGGPLIIIDDVVLEGTVRCLNRLGCRMLITTRDREIAQAFSIPTDVIRIGNFTREECDAYLKLREYPSASASEVYASTVGHPALLWQLTTKANGNPYRLLELCTSLRISGPKAVSCISAYEHSSVTEAFERSVQRTPETLRAPLAVVLLMPEDLWIPANVWALVLPVDVCVSSLLINEVTDALSRIASRCFLEENQDDRTFRLPRIVQASLKNSIDKRMRKALQKDMSYQLRRQLEDDRPYRLNNRSIDNGYVPPGQSPLTETPAEFLRRHQHEFRALLEFKEEEEEDVEEQEIAEDPVHEKNKLPKGPNEVPKTSSPTITRPAFSCTIL